MRIYVDFQYYRDTFKGNLIPGDAFDRHARMASVFVREITFNRADANYIAEEVKDAVCAVCEVYYAQEIKQQSGRDGRELKSESNDGYNVSYVTESQDGELSESLLRRKSYDAAYPYLIHTGLLDRGCR